MVRTKWLSLLFPVLVCGNIRLQPRIFNGHNATEGQFPFVTSIHDQNEYSNGFFCSAAIIHEEWVLTAGHCFKETSRRESTKHIVVGTIFKNEGQQYAVSEVIVHPEFHQTQAHIANDLALVRLAKPLTWSKIVQPIALESLSNEEKTLIEAGWGEVEPFHAADVLQFVDLNIMDTEQCQKIHAPFNNTVDGATQICVCSDEGATPCFGDSGGPLVSTSTGRLVGIFSGMEDCSGKYPVLFVRVSAFVKWIEKETGLEFPLK